MRDESIRFAHTLVISFRLHSIKKNNIMCGVGRFMKLNNMAQGVGRVGIGVRHGFNEFMAIFLVFKILFYFS